MEKLTEKLAEFCENIKFEKLPKDVVERTKLLILDTVGIIIRARHDAESTESLIKAIQTLDLDNGNCKVFSDKNNYAPSAAALINGTLAHSLDLMILMLKLLFIQVHQFYLLLFQLHK